MIRPGLVSVTFRQLAVREIVLLAASCGLDGIEWGGDVHVTNLSAAREARRMTEDAGLSVAAFGSYWRAEDADDFETVREIGTALGAPTLRVWAGTKGSREVGGEDERQRTADVLRCACELAAEAGMTLSLEYHGGTLTDELRSALRLAQSIDHPALRLYWQPVPGRDPSIRSSEVRALLAYLSNLHVFHWVLEEGRVQRRPLAEGEAEWTEILRLAHGPRYALMEFLPNDDPRLLMREATTLRRWLS